MSTEKKVPVSSFDEGIHVMKQHIEIPEEYAPYGYALLSQETTGLVVTVKDGKPCFGELRPYGKSVNPEQAGTRGKDYKPNDLPHGFPDGEILAVCVRPVAYGQVADTLAFSTPSAEVPQLQWALDPKESPWRTCLTDFEFTPWTSTSYGSLLWRSTDFGPSIMVNLLMSMRRVLDWVVYARNPKIVDSAEQALGRKLTPPEYWLVLTCLDTLSGNFMVGPTDPYSIDLVHASIPNFLAGKPFDLDGGLTFRERAAYNRAYIHAVFGHRYSDVLGNTDWEHRFQTFEEAWEAIQRAAAQPIKTEAAADGTDLLASQSR